MSSGASSSTARAAMRCFSGAAAPGLDVEMGLVEALVHRHGAAVDAPDAARRRQRVEVAADGGLGDAEGGAELLERGRRGATRRSGRGAPGAAAARSCAGIASWLQNIPRHGTFYHNRAHRASMIGDAAWRAARRSVARRPAGRLRRMRCGHEGRPPATDADRACPAPASSTTEPLRLRRDDIHRAQGRLRSRRPDGLLGGDGPQRRGRLRRRDRAGRSPGPPSRSGCSPGAGSDHRGRRRRVARRS